MSMVRVCWHVLLRVGSQSKAHLLLSRIEEQLGLAVVIDQCVRYWKDATLYEASFTTNLESIRNAAEAVYETLILAGRLGPGWSVGPPQSYADGGFSLSGWTFTPEGFVVSGLVSASFHLTNAPADLAASIP